MANCSLIYNILRVIKIFESRKSFIPSHSPPPPSEYLLGNPIRLLKLNGKASFILRTRKTASKRKENYCNQDGELL